MSWHFGAPGDYQGSPYATNLPSASSTNPQGRSTYAPVASTSANPYNHLPHPQNPTPPVQSASFYRPPTTTIRSLVQSNRPAYLNPALTPSFPPPPPQFLRYHPVPSTSSAPLPPAELPPPTPPTEPSTIEKINIPSTEQTENQTGGGKKKKNKKGKQEKADEMEEVVDKDAFPFERMLSHELDMYFKVILVVGLAGQLTLVRHSKDPAEDIKQGFRLLQTEEKEDLRSFARELSEELLREYASKGPVQPLPEGTRISEARRIGIMGLDGNEPTIQLKTSQGTEPSQTAPIDYRSSAETPFLNLREICKERCLGIAHKILGKQQEALQGKLRAEECHRQGEAKRKRAMTKMVNNTGEAGGMVKVNFDEMPEEIDERTFWIFQGAYLSSIIVNRSADSIASFRLADGPGIELTESERYLWNNEKKALRRWSTAHDQEAEGQDGDQRRTHPVQVESVSSLEEGEILEESLNSSDTHKSVVGVALKAFVRPFLFELQARRLKTKKKNASGVSLDREDPIPVTEDRNEEISNRVDVVKGTTHPIDSNPTKALDTLESLNTLDSLRLAPLGTEVKAGGSREELKSSPRDTESLIGSPSLPFTSSTISTSQASDHNETSKGFESSSAPASIVSTSVIPINAVSLSTPSLSSLSLSTPPLSTPRPDDDNVALPTPNTDSLPQISISPLTQPLPSQNPSPFPAKVEEDANLVPSFDRHTVKIKEEGFVETLSKEGEDGMGQNQFCELELKKESVDIGEDLRAIKEEESTLSTREELPQFVQQSNSHAEPSPTRIEPQATLVSQESGIQVEDESEVGGHLEVTRGQEAEIAGGKVTNNSNEKELPSSDLSEVDEEVIAESGSENSAAESITEVLAKRKARRGSSTSIVRPEKKRSKLLPDYLDDLLEDEENYTLWWDDPSVSASAKAFVLEREKIFALQRSFVDLPKQRAAMQVVTSPTGIVTQPTHRHYLAILATYLSFCAIAKLPPFPITSAMIALYLYQYRAQWPQMSRTNNPAALRFFTRRTVQLFDDQSEAYKQLDSWHDSDLLIRELRKPIEATKSSVSTRSDARRDTRTSSSVRASPAVPSKPVLGRSNLKKPQARSTSSQFELVIPERRDQRRVDRTSKSPMTIESSISFTSAKLSTSRDLRNVPNPGIGQRFKSLRAVKMSTAVAVIYSQGYTIGTNTNSESTAISVYCEGPGPAEKGCDFRVHASLDSGKEEWVIDGCINDHSHEPSQTLQDVEWRPSTIDPNLIQAMYQIDRKGQLDESLRKLVTTKRSTEVSHDEEQPNKRIRTQSSPLSERTTSEQPFLAHAPIPPQSSVEPSRRATSPSPSLNNEKPLLSNSSSFPAPFTNLPPRSKSFASSLPPQRLSEDPFFKTVEVPPTIAATSPLLDLSTPPAPQIHGCRTHST